MNRLISSTKSLILILCLSSLFLPYVHAIEDVYTETNTLKRTLANGMTVVIHEVHKTPIVAIYLIVKTGSATEGRFSGSGISHLVEHMLFKDYGGKKKVNIKERIKLLGGYINGFTAHDYTGYTVTISNEYTTKALKTLKDIVAWPSFDALELKKEKAVIVDEIRKNRDKPSRLALDLSWELAFQQHPYKYPIIGYEDLLGRLGKMDLDKYYRERYSPQNMILAISGDVQKEALFEEIDWIFGPLKRGFAPAISSVSEPVQLNQRTRTEERPTPLSHVVLSYKSAPIDDATLYPLDILATALGKGNDSILLKELRDKKKLVYAISCRNYTLRDSGLFYIHFISEYSKVDDAISATLEEFEKIKEKGISEAILEKSKNIAEAEFLNAYQTIENRARDIATSEALVNDYNLSEFYLNKLLGVNADNVKSVASAYLKTDSLNIVHISPEISKEAPESSYSIEEPGRKTIKELLPNGMRILICEDSSIPVCTISAMFLGGARSENSENNGVSHLISKLLLDGTEKRSEEEIKSEIESAGGSTKSIAGNNSFGIRLNLLSDDWGKGIEIISDAIMNSTFSKEKIEKEMSLALAGIRERDNNIVKAGLMLFRENLYGEHPYRLDPLGTEESVQGLTRDDIIAHYESLCVPANLVLAICGDINTEKVLSEVRRQFGLYKPKEPKLPEPPVPEIPKWKKEVSESMEKEQSLVIVGFPSVKFTDSDRYIFEVMDAIMSGMGGRMFTNIRDRMGISYSQDTVFIPGMEQGCYMFYALTSADNVKSARKAILKEIKNLRGKAISENELEAAKRYVIASQMSNLQKNNAFALKISLDELYGLGYDNFETYSDKINEVTPKHVRRAASQYFSTKRRFITTIYGEGDSR